MKLRLIKILTLLVVLTSLDLPAQVQSLTRKSVYHVFANTVAKPATDFLNQDSLEWQACEPNYYRSDTIRLYNHKYYYLWNEDSCCSIVSWYFDSRKRVNISEGLYCGEPPIDVIRPRRRCELLQQKQELILRISGGEQSEECYRIISLERKNVPGAPRPVMVLTLLRL